VGRFERGHIERQHGASGGHELVSAAAGTRVDEPNNAAAPQGEQAPSYQRAGKGLSSQIQRSRTSM
jgi:hypothetical protein